MKRIYHTYEKWECYRAGFYESAPPEGMTPQQATEEYTKFLRNLRKFKVAAGRVINEWTNSCEHYLSNEKMNRIAWIGQAAMCIYSGVPACFRGGFNALSETDQEAANQVALDTLNCWLRARGEPETDMKGAGVEAKANIY